MIVNFPRVTLTKFLEFMNRLKGVKKVNKSKLAKSLGYKLQLVSRRTFAKEKIKHL